MSTWGTVYELERDRATGNNPESLRAEIRRLENIINEMDQCGLSRQAAEVLHPKSK